jgi:hypothetical protein
VKTLTLFVVAVAVAAPVSVVTYILTTQLTANLFVDMTVAG